LTAFRERVVLKQCDDRAFNVFVTHGKGQCETRSVGDGWMDDTTLVHTEHLEDGEARRSPQHFIRLPAPL